MADPNRKGAERELRKILDAAQSLPGLVRLGPKAPWQIEVALCSASAMSGLNSAYRDKDYSTDVLSFPAPAPFRARGVLGELVICLPVLKRQAAEAGHSSAQELKVLLVHGVLHLLGLDHEKSARDAARMAAWEARLLRSPGLIKRSRSGNRKAL